MGKMWRDCIKRGILITLLIPVVNCLIILLTGLREGAVFGCNWNITGSLAKTWIPYHELVYENTFAVIVLMLLLDILRLHNLVAYHILQSKGVYILMLDCGFFQLGIHQYVRCVQEYQRLKNREGL